MSRLSHSLWLRARASLLHRQAGVARAIADFQPDIQFRERMLLQELRSKHGRFYVVDPPVAHHVANLCKPYVEGKDVIHATPGPGVLTVALMEAAETGSMRVMDHSGFFVETLETLQETKFPFLKVYHGNILRTTPEVPGSEDDEDFDTLMLSVFPTFDEVMDGIPETEWSEDASFAIVAPFGPETIRFLGILLPHVCGQTGWFAHGRCTIIGGVSCLPDDPVLLGSAPPRQSLPYCNAAIENVFDIKLLDEMTVNHVTNGKVGPGVHGKQGHVRFFAFTPKIDVPSALDLALYRVIFPQAANLGSLLVDHIRSHGITEQYVNAILQHANVDAGAEIRELRPKDHWNIFLGYKKFCEKEFLEKLFMRLAVVKYDDSPDAFRDVEIEENRRQYQNYGRGLDTSFWDVKSARFNRTQAAAPDDNDLLFEGEFDPH